MKSITDQHFYQMGIHQTPEARVQETLGIWTHQARWSWC